MNPFEGPSGSPQAGGAARQVWPEVSQAWPGTATLVPVSPGMPEPGKGTQNPWEWHEVAWKGLSPPSRAWGEMTAVQHCPRPEE